MIRELPSFLQDLLAAPPRAHKASTVISPKTKQRALALIQRIYALDRQSNVRKEEK